MDRRTWLDDRRSAVASAYDAAAPTYDQDPYPAQAQARFVARLLETCPPGGLVLDAPCGTGRYFGQVIEAGRRVVGVDGSAGMLAMARERGLAEALHRLDLQELTFVREFDAVMTIDAMENVPPEDWPLVIANLHRAVRPGGHLYLTVEEQPDALVDAAFQALSAAHLPAVRGEVVEAGAAGYHFYPGRERVVGWIAGEDLRIVDESHEAAPDGSWAYRHFLLRDGRSASG
jgi:SAM-dependent methyltransferase